MNIDNNSSPAGKHLPDITKDTDHNMVDSVMGTPVPPKTDAMDILAIQSLYTAYAASFPVYAKNKAGFNYAEYFNPARLAPARALHGQRLEIAKDLALALLSRYYPADQGYRVESAKFPLLEFGGWRFWVYPEDCYTVTKRKADNRKVDVKKNAKPVYDAWSGNINADKFHRILSEHIAGFVVLNEIEYEDGSGGWAQHTYLGIMMDDLETYEHWVSEKLQRPDKNLVSVPRADMLNDAMGTQAGISAGYAILMLGPRIEFYNYNAKPAWEERSWEDYLGPDPENNPEYDPDPEFVAGQEVSSCFTHLDGGDADNVAWMVDVRSDPTLATIDKLFKSVAGRDVHYRGGYSLPGPELQVSPRPKI